MKAKTKSTKPITNWANVSWLILIQLTIALQWLLSGWGKFASDEFVVGFSKTINVFIAKTPNGSYASFLNEIVLPNADFFANLVRISEILIGLALVIFGVYYYTQRHLPISFRLLLVLALFGGALLNLNFYLAAGWSSPSTAGINMLMGLIQLILGAFYAKGLIGGK